MMLAFVDGMAAEPRDISIGRLRIIVDAWTPELGGGQAAEYGRHQIGGHRQLPFDLVRRFVRVPCEEDTFIAVHSGKAGALLDKRQQRPVSLYEQHIPDVAGVLQCGPHIGSRPPPQQRLAHAIAELCPVSFAEGPQRIGHAVLREFFIHEPTLNTLSHHTRIAPHLGSDAESLDFLGHGSSYRRAQPAPGTPEVRFADT